jgi:hypothetical protein
MNEHPNQKGDDLIADMISVALTVVTGLVVIFMVWWFVAFGMSS